MIELAAAHTHGFGTVFVLMYAVGGVVLLDVLVVAMIALHFARNAVAQIRAD